MDVENIEIRDSLFENNHVEDEHQNSDGGAGYIENSKNILIENTDFEKCSVHLRGGALSLYSNENTVFKNVKFEGNELFFEK